MHIKNLHRPTASRQHRLYIAVPLFTLCIALSFGSAAFQGSSLNPDGQQVHGVAAEGTGSFTWSGAVMRLDSGNALFAARGIARVQAGAFEARGWNGVFDLTLQQGALDIAALTTPVIVRTSTDLWIVPAGTQQRIAMSSPVFGDDPSAWIAARRPAPLPEHYLRERLPAAAILFEAASFTPVQSNALMLIPFAGNLLRLPAARERVEATVEASALHDLHRALHDGDAESARAVLLADASGNVLTSNEASTLLPELIALAQRIGLESLLVPYVMRDQDQLLLALLHGSVRGHAWMLSPWPDMTTDVRIAALLSLPLADHDEDAVSELAVERWGMRWNDLLMQTDLPLLFADTVLAPLEADIVSLEQRGYPERARRYAAAVVGAFYPRMEEFSPEAAASLERLGAFAAGGSVVTAPVTVPVAQSQASSSSSVAPDPQRVFELENAVRAMLTEAGCMFTSKTAIRAISTDRVVVDQIVVGTHNGDQLIGFLYDVAADRVVNIEKDGTTLPYSLSLAQYLAWVKEGK